MIDKKLLWEKLSYDLNLLYLKIACSFKNGKFCEKQLTKFGLSS